MFVCLSLPFSYVTRDVCNTHLMSYSFNGTTYFCIKEIFKKYVNGVIEGRGGFRNGFLVRQICFKTRTSSILNMIYCN